MKFSRTWDMPNADTFKVKAIGCFVKRWLLGSKVSIDPFARNSRLATYRNDINPETGAEYHMEAEGFLKHLGGLGVKADLFIFDPPYSARQVKECYENMGRKMQMEDGQTARLKRSWRDAAVPLLTSDAVVLSFGWNTVGFGKKLGFEVVEILDVVHGGDHNDTLCVAEKRINNQKNLEL